MPLAYDGPHASVDVPALGLFGVRRGEPIEIDPAAVAQLEAQGWVAADGGDDNNDDESEGSD